MMQKTCLYWGLFLNNRAESAKINAAAGRSTWATSNGRKTHRLITGENPPPGMLKR
jgi:hypothetical protein